MDSKTQNRKILENIMDSQTQNKNYQFRYVDFASRLQPHFRNNVVRLERIPQLLEKYGSFECYSTYFLFTSGIIRYMKKNIISGRRSVSGYRGLLYAHYFPIDIDCPFDLGYSREAAIETLRKLKDEIGIQDNGINIYFSGKKGFHLMVDTGSFGLRPSGRLNYYFAAMRKRIAKMAGEYGRAIDCNISDPVRLLRMPNTVNAKSGLYKIQLTEDELCGLSAGRIRSLARHKRPIEGTDISGLIPLEPARMSPKAKEFYLECAGRAGRMHSLGRNADKHSRILKGQNPETGMCPAVEKIYGSRIPEGNRNNAALMLASYFLNQEGKDAVAVQSILSDWNNSNSIGLGEAELSRIVRSAERGGYIFGCSSLADYCPYGGRESCRICSQDKPGQKHRLKKLAGKGKYV